MSAGDALLLSRTTSSLNPCQPVSLSRVREPVSYFSIWAETSREVPENFVAVVISFGSDVPKLA